MTPEDEARLRKMLESLPGKAGYFARWLIASHWESLCWITEYYANPGTDCKSPKNREAEWKVIAESARVLIARIENLSDDARCDSEWHYDRRVMHFSWMKFSNQLRQALWTSEQAMVKCQEEKSWCKPNSKAERESINRKALFRHINSLLDECGERVRPSHVQQIGLAIDDWVAGESETHPNKRWGERALKSFIEIERWRITRTPKARS